jgi:peptidyl-prolyl cis-trans isomerase SurA
MVSKLKKENNFRSDKQLVQSVLQGPSANEINTANVNPDATLFTLNDTAYTAGSFYQYAENQRENIALAELYHQFVEEQVFAYEEAHLSEKYDAYRLLLNEYYDGILLFEMMEKEVWTKATKDSIGLQNFFEMHRQQYQWKERVEATLFEIPNEGMASQLQKSIANKKFPLDEESKEALEKEFSGNGNTLNILYGTYEREQTRYTTAEKVIDKVNWTRGEKQITDNGKVYLVKIHEVLPPGQKKLNEIRGIVIADYQNHLEKKWVNSLKQVYVINVNEDVLQQIIHSLQ